MGRIEEIKEEAIKAIKCDEESSLDYHYDMDMGNHIKTQVANVHYLLSRLKIAEKALEVAKDKSALAVNKMCGGSVDRFVFEQARSSYYSIEEALQQIRE